MNHGLYFREVETSIQVPQQVSQSLTVAVGTAVKNSLNKPVICYNYKEFVENFGEEADFENYTLNEVAQVFYKIYNLSPVIFINCFDGSKHFDEITETFTDETSFALTGNIDTDTIKITTGENIEPTVLVAGQDYICDSMYLHGADSDPVVAIEFLSLSKIVGGKFKVTYRQTRQALGGEPVTEEVNVSELEDNIYELTDDCIIESVVVESGGKQTLREVPFKLDTDDNKVIVNILLGVELEDDTCKVTYHALNPEKVTAQEIIDALDQIDSIQGRWNLNPGIIIAPKFSLDSSVASALANKAKTLDAMAVVDIDSTKYPTYTDACTFKNSSNLSSANLIVCYPKVALSGTEYFLSTHLAALMNRVDSENEDFPYVSPSNQPLQCDSVIADDKELFLTQEQANLLNSNGIVTVLAYGGSFRAWGNYTACFPTSNDVKDIWISTRRTLNFIKLSIRDTYITRLDCPITRRAIDAILQSINIWLASLTARQLILGAECSFDESENSVTDLLAGKIAFVLRYAAATPAQSIEFRLTFDTSYFSTLFE